MTATITLSFFGVPLIQLIKLVTKNDCEWIKPNQSLKISSFSTFAFYEFANNIYHAIVLMFTSSIHRLTFNKTFITYQKKTFIMLSILCKSSKFSLRLKIFFWGQQISFLELKFGHNMKWVLIFFSLSYFAFE